MEVYSSINALTDKNSTLCSGSSACSSMYHTQCNVKA